MDNKRKRFLNAVSMLPPEFIAVLQNAPALITDNAQEITLRTNRPLCVQCPQKRYYFTKNNCVTDTILNSQMVVASEKSIFDTFQNICNYSIYSRQNEINNGFVTLKGGHRAGICGTAVVTDDRITNIKDITSINIRIAREVFGCAQKLDDVVEPHKGVLICGAPCSGKTTILRDYARKLSFDYKVSVVDERNELSSTVNGVFQNDMGMCDVFNNYKKCDAITHAVRCMSPDIIVCDEIATFEDVDALSFGVNSGVSFIATMHSDSLKSLRNRAFFSKLIETKAFSYIVILDSRHNVGQIKSVLSANEIGGV